MGWQPISMQFPPSAQTLSDAVAQTLADGAGEIATSLTRLDAVIPSIVRNPAAATATGSAATWANLLDFFDGAGQLLVVHPYQEGVGQGTGYSRHLSAPNAQRALAAKLADSWDSFQPAGNLEAAALLFAEQTLENFANRLAAFNGLAPVPELQLAQRRADQLLRLEAEKSVLPGAPQGGSWRPRRLRQLHIAAQSAARIGGEVASAYGYELENTDPKAELQALAQKKQSHLVQVQADLDALAALFVSTGPASCIWAAGSERDIASQLLASEPYGHNHVFSAALLFTAPAGELTFLREMLGL